MVAGTAAVDNAPDLGIEAAKATTGMCMKWDQMNSREGPEMGVGSFGHLSFA